MIITGRKMEFDAPKSVSLAYPGGAVYEFKCVVSLFKDESGTIHLTKNNDNIVEVLPGYLFIEVGDSGDGE